MPVAALTQLRATTHPRLFKVKGFRHNRAISVPPDREDSVMTRYRIGVTQTVQIDEQDLQAAAIAFPTLLAAIADPDIRMAQASNPENAAQMLALEMRNQLLYILPHAQIPMPDFTIDPVE